MSPSIQSDRPYAGLRVVDFSMGWAGPSLTQMLADHGADVVKIESCTHADWWRTSRRLFTEEPEDLELAWERSPLFNSVNENKRGITLDLDHPDGRRFARLLIAQTDLVVENYTPRVMRNFGLDYDSVRELNPTLVMVSMPAFGSTGPWADYKATAMVTESAAGLSWLSGEPNEPFLSSTAIADPNAGVIGALSVAVALRARRTTGRGQHIEVAQTEALTPLIGEALLETQLTGNTPARRGNRSATTAPRGIFPAAGEDRWIAVDVETDQQWHALATILGIDASAWPTTSARLDDQDALEAAMSERTASEPAADLAARLQTAGVPAAPVNDAEQVLDDPHLGHRAFFREVDRAVVGTFPYPTPPVHLSNTPAHRAMPAPTLGQHNHEVLARDLGLTPEEIAGLEAEGVIGTSPRVASR